MALEWLKDPAVISGLIGASAGLVAPYVASLVRRKANGRIAAEAAAVAAESRRIEATEKRLQDLLDRQAQEISGLERKLDERGLEIEQLAAEIVKLREQDFRNARKFDGILAALLDEARMVRDQVREREDHDEVLPNVEKLVRALRDARGDFFNSTRSA